MTAPPEQADERRLIEAAQRDPRHFAELYGLTFERLYAYVARRVKNRQDAEDVTSEVFRRALKNIGRFEWQGTPFIAWLYRIAANEIADRRQFSSRRVTEPLDDFADSRIAADVERRATLSRLVDALPKTQRRVIVMRFIEQKRIHEIARELEKTEGAVKQLQFRALETLRARLEDRCE